MKKVLSVFVFSSFLILGKIIFGEILVGTFATAEELILKVKNNPILAGWVYQKGNLENSYCLYERNYMILASANIDLMVNNPILKIFKEHGSDILSSSFSISNKHFVSLDSNGVLVERMFADVLQVNVRKVHEKLKPASVAISPDDSVELVGFKNGFIQAHSLLKKAKKNVDVFFKAHSGSVYSISFNALGNYFASSGEDGKVKIWRAKDLRLLREVDAFIKKDDTISFVPAIFSPLNDIFAYASSEKMLALSDIQGKNINTIFISDGIKEVHFTEKKDAIAVLTLSNTLEFYSIHKGKYLGTIPSLSNLSISSLSINIITGNLLIATKEGEIYLCAPKEIKNVRLAKKNEKMKEASSYMTEGSKQKGKSAKLEDSKTSQNILEYWGLEDGINVRGQVRKPFFSIKDETPLEAPLVVLPYTEIKKNKPQSQKTLDQTIFDEEVEFQPIILLDEEDVEDEESSEDDEDEGNDAKKIQTENSTDKVEASNQQEESSPEETTDSKEDEQEESREDDKDLEEK